MADNSAIVALTGAAKSGNNNSEIVALNTVPAKSDNNNSEIVALTSAIAALTNAPAKSDNNNSEIVALTSAIAALTNAPAKSDNNNSEIVALTSAMAANNNTLVEPDLIQAIDLKQEQTELENISKNIPCILFRKYEERLYQTLKKCLNKEIDNIVKKAKLKKQYNTVKTQYENAKKELDVIFDTKKNITKDWLTNMDKLYTTVYKKSLNNSYFTTQYLKYIEEYDKYKGIYKSPDELSLQITPDQFEQFAYIDHHADADDVFYGKKSGGARTRNKAINKFFKDTKTAIVEGAKSANSKFELKSKLIGRRITDIQKAYDTGNVYFMPETDILKIIGSDRFDFTRKYNDNVWFLAVCIFDPNLQYFHLRDWTMEDGKAKLRFFWNFTKEIGSYNTFNYLTRRNVIGFDEKTKTIDLTQNIFSKEYTDAVIRNILKKKKRKMEKTR